MRTLSLLPILLSCLLGCAEIPGRHVQDRCFIYYEPTDMCIHQDGGTEADWKKNRPWEEGRERVMWLEIDSQEDTWAEFAK